MVKAGVCKTPITGSNPVVASTSPITKLRPRRVRVMSSLLKIVSERLGHSTIGVTLDVHSHMMPDLQSQAAAKLDRLVGR